jgi:hypothetical protein
MAGDTVSSVQFYQGGLVEKFFQSVGFFEGFNFKPF